MERLVDMRPAIRVAHHYRFPVDRNTYEAGRRGYCYAWHLVDGGKGTITASGRTYNVSKGELIYFPPGMPHSFSSDTAQPLSTYNIYCDLWSNRTLASKSVLVWGEEAFDPESVTPVVAGTELDEWPSVLPLQHEGGLIERFVRIVERHQAQDANSETIASCLLKAFILEGAQVSRHAEPADYRIQSVIARIDKEAAADLRYDNWLASTGLHKTQFHELFKRATGLSPKAYNTRALMKRAAAALRESGRSVTDIAEYFGYSSIHHFTKQFTAYYGVSPTKFRRRRT